MSGPGAERNGLQRMLTSTLSVMRRLDVVCDGVPSYLVDISVILEFRQPPNNATHEGVGRGSTECLV